MSNIVFGALGLRGHWLRSMALSLVVLCLVAEVARGQTNNNNGGFGSFGTRVGGVSIDAAGMVTPAEKSARIPMRDALRKQHAAPPAELNGAVEMRMVSLRRLD